ncbi:MAG TPA: hypothetical protein VHP83_23055 [Aggregatilineaceae bacterium]|nr:hypothetical protein [Aggregatilineaceae bacterium]
MKRLVLIVFLSIFTLALGSQSAGAASPAIITSITAENCSIFVEVYAYVEGEYTVRLLDDGHLLQTANISASVADAYYTVQFNLGVLGSRAPGIGIYLSGGGANDSVDPYIPDIAATCGAGPDQVVLPSSAVGGTLVQSAELYWGPDPGQLVKPLVTLAVGKHVLVVGPDATDAFYKIIFAGKSLWVRAETLGPNFDSVWGGRPLPTNAVQ